MGAMGPVVYPSLLAAIIIGFALWQLGGFFVSAAKAAEPRNGEAADFRTGLSRVAVVAVILVVYTWLLVILGYLILTPALLAILVWLLGERRWWLILINSFGFSLALYFIFQNLIYVIMPENSLF